MTVRSYKEFIEQFDNEKIYTERNMADALNAQRDELVRRYTVNRVVFQGKDCDTVMIIVSVCRTEEGTLVKVR